MSNREMVTRLAVVAALLLGPNVSAQATPQACGRSWTIVPSPNPNRAYDVLHDVSAISSRDAWAVGSFLDRARGEGSTLVEHWDGTAWSVIASPNEGEGSNTLQAVEAIAADDVWAVGSSTQMVLGTYVPVPLILHWDGDSWRIVPSPRKGSPPNGALAAILAVGPDDVWAAGSFALDPLRTVDWGRETLIEHWNGQRWAVVSSSNVPMQLANGLVDLAATGPTDLWALGAFLREDSGTSTLIEHWDGSGWGIVESPNRSRPQWNPHSNELRGAVAVSASDVWAVGEGEGRTLATRWDGESWSIVRVPAPGIISGLYATDAVRPGRVLAVGTYLQATTLDFVTLAMRWNGRRWRIIASENVRGAFDNRLEGLAVVPGRQFAVGSSTSERRERSVQRTLIEQRCPVTGRTIAIGQIAP